MTLVSSRLATGSWSAWLRSFLCFTLLLTGAFAGIAKADFIEPYALSDFTLTNSSFGNGDAFSPDGGVTLILTGPNDGSGLPGSTQLTVTSLGAGLLMFDYIFTCLDEPGFDFAGYLLNGGFHMLADLDGQSGSVALPVLPGDVMGFHIESLDNIGEPGVLTISNFRAPVPEPGGFWLVLGALASGLAGKRAWALRRRLRLRPKRGVGAVGLGLLCFSLPVPAQQADYFNGTNVTGQVILTGVVNVRQQAQVMQTSGFKFAQSKGEKTPKAPPPRLYPPLNRAFSLLGAPIPPIKGLNIVNAPGVTGFNALSHFDQRMANNGNQWSIEPPSQSIAVGNGYVLEGVNDAIQVYSLSGVPALPTVVSSNQLFGLAPTIDWNTGVNGVYLTDMRVYFDHGINRWFVIQRSQDNDVFGTPLNQSHLYMAVSRTADPTGDYYIYVMDTTNASHPGCPCLADYPQIGSDQYGFHIAWNEFTTYSYPPMFVDAAILSLSKASLAGGSASPSAYQFTMPFTTGYEFAIQPATTPPGASSFLGAGGVEYFVSSMSRSSMSASLGLWALRNTSSLATTNPNMVLSRIAVQTLPYTFPDVATQRPGPLPYGDTFGGMLAYLDGGDPRVLAVSYAGGRLFLTLQTGVADENSRWVVGGAYIVLSPTLRSNILGGSVLKQGYLVVNGNHVLRPAIAVNAKGQGAIAVTLVGPEWYPTAALIPFDTWATPAELQIGSPGTLPEDGFTGYPDWGGVGIARWGDYNGAVAASDGSIWMAVQYIGSYPRTEFANWNTYVMRKQ